MKTTLTTTKQVETRFQPGDTIKGIYSYSAERTIERIELNQYGNPIYRYTSGTWDFASSNLQLVRGPSAAQTYKADVEADVVVEHRFEPGDVIATRDKEECPWYKYTVTGMHISSIHGQPCYEMDGWRLHDTIKFYDAHYELVGGPRFVPKTVDTVRWTIELTPPNDPKETITGAINQAIRTLPYVWLKHLTISRVTEYSDGTMEVTR